MKLKGTFLAVNRNKRNENEQIERLGVAFLIAILLHIAILPLVPHLLPTPEKLPDATEVQTVMMSPEEWDKNMRPSAADDRTAEQGAEAKVERGPAEEKRTPEEVAQEKKKKDENKNGQVVYIGPAEDNRPPDDARFLAEFNSRVERESISKYRRPDYLNPLPKPSVSSEAAPTGEPGEVQAPGIAMRMKPSPEQIKPSEPKLAKPKPSTDDRLVLKMPSMAARPELMLPRDQAGTISNSEKTDEITGNSDRYELRFGGRKAEKKDDDDPFGGSLPPRVAALMPNGASAGRISGGPFSEHVEGVEEGEGTFLNAREYKYAVFFNRVKRSVSQVWDPGSQLYKRDPSGTIFGQKDRLTVLKIVLDGAGALKEASVEKQCGLEFLDQEAVMAFKRAQPFPNPPSGLMKDGQIAFTFGFYVEFSSSSFKLFRYAN